ncbi:MAG TPA: FtsX-like permease family protein [Nakamurella sp.]
MFVAWRDLRTARGRFALIAGVVALITVLVGFLTGLTGGLAAQNVSAILGLDATRIVTGAGAQSFADSALTADQVVQWQQTGAQVEPLGISQLRAGSGDASTGVALFGATDPLDPAVPVADGTVSLSADAATVLHAAAGDPVEIAGRSYTVAAITPAAWYSHTPVVWLTLGDWHQIARATGAGAGATVLIVRGDADWSAIEAATGTRSATPLQALPEIGAFRSEIGSLALIIGLLFAISALVVGAFFVVWGMQRRGDVAILKALGASHGSLRRDSLGQAAVVLAAGVGVGTAAVAAVGSVLPSAVPFLLSPLTTLAPAILLILLGLVGAVVALRPVTAADPLTALGSNR